MNSPIAFTRAFRRANVDERTLRCQAAGEDIRAAFLSDVHFSRMFPERSLACLIEQLESLSPDLLLLGGDYAESLDYQRGFFNAVGELRPRLGAFAVMGNNDGGTYPEGRAPVIEVMRGSGVTPLVNETAVISLPRGRLRIGGLDEAKFGAARPELLFKGEKGENDFDILIEHYPGATRRAIARLKPDLALCGHTHGGQVCVFGMHVYRLGFERASDGQSPAMPIRGWHDVGGTKLLISSGVGASRMPIRVGVPSQIHIITLSSNR